MKRALLLFFLLSGCASTTAEYIGKLEGYRVVQGYIFKLDGLTDPKVTKLKNGTAYEVTTEGCTVLMYFDKRDPRTRRRMEQEFQLKPGDRFINSRPTSFVLIKE